jgi:hypothetical protein
MKLSHIIKSTAAAFALVVALGVSTARADSAVPKTYPLKTCVVSGDTALSANSARPPAARALAAGSRSGFFAKVRCFPAAEET